MAGKWDKSGNQRIGLDGRPEVGARCYFFEAATTTPLTTYSDYSLAVPNPAFVETDSYGQWPEVYFDDSVSAFFRERATDDAGSVIYFDNDAVPIVGPGEGGGAEVPVDPNSLLETGDIKVRYGTGVKAGFVRLNGRTIGNAVSGGSERADADTQDLFEYLYGADANLTVSGGRGASATADYEANKTIALPDFLGCALVGLDDMGAAAAGRISGFTTLGELAGVESAVLTTGQIPQMSLASGVAASNGAHTHTVPQQDQTTVGGSGLAIASASTTETQSTTTSSNGAHTHTVTGTVGAASPTAVSRLQPSRAVTFYMKL
jgi:microcystin-dependent protein